jgi:DNA-binding SARP family transcriptional activator
VWPGPSAATYDCAVGTTVEVGLLGRFSLHIDGAPVPGDAWRSRRAADVVKLLALSPHHRLHREQVMEALWPDSEPEGAATNLRKALHFVRRALGEDSIANESGVLVLWPSADVTTDLDRFESATDIQDAVRLYGGELLPDDRYESWSAEHRARLHRRYLDLLRSAGMWERLAAEDPTDEEAARVSMKKHVDAGRRRAAMRSFEVLREALRDQLGVGPDAETVALYEQVLAMEGSEPASPAERAHALLAWALVHMNRQDLAEAERAAAEAREIALDVGLGRELGEAAIILAKVAMAQGRWRERFAEELTESMRLRANMEPIVYDAHLCLAEYYLAAPDGYETAASFAREMLKIAEEAGSATGAALAILMLGEAELLSGRIDDAEQHLKVAFHANEREGCISGAALATQRLAEAAVARGRRYDANRLLRRARTLAARSDIRTHLLVRVFGTMIQAAVDPDGAAAVLRTVERELTQMRACEPCSMGFLTSAAAAAAHVGDLERARSFVAEAERISGMWQGGPWAGAVWEARGILRGAEGDDEQARAMFREAADVFARAGNQVDAARCLAAAAG